MDTKSGHVYGTPSLIVKEGVPIFVKSWINFGKCTK